MVWNTVVFKQCNQSIPAICYCIPTKGCLHIQRQFYMFYLKSYSNIITWLYVLKSCICFGQNGMKRLFGESPKSDILPSTGGHVWTPQIHLLAAGFEQKSHKFICRKCLFRCVFSLMFCFFSEMNPKEILHLSNRMIVIMTDESQKWKIASLECALYIFWVFLSFLFFSPLFPLSSLTLHSNVFSPSLIISFFSSHTPLCFDSLSSSFIYPYMSLSCYPVCPPLSILSSSPTPLLLSSPLLSFPVPTSIQLPFVPVCQKSAAITGCCCITVAIMQIYLLFNVSKNAFFVRVRINLHWLIFITTHVAILHFLNIFT